MSDRSRQGSIGNCGAYLPVDLLVRQVWDTEIGAGFGHVHLILLHRRVVGVVTVVGDAPGEVRSPHEGVRDEADDVGDGSVGGECTVASLGKERIVRRAKMRGMLKAKSKNAPRGQ